MVAMQIRDVAFQVMTAATVEEQFAPARKLGALHPLVARISDTQLELGEIERTNAWYCCYAPARRLKRDEIDAGARRDRPQAPRDLWNGPQQKVGQT